jgi:hypothetical protein
MRPLDPNRTHPLFPTHEEIAERRELLYSDHLPVLFDVPLEGESDTSIKVISWNVLGHNAPSGFHTSRSWEDEASGRQRFERIIQSLKLFAKNQNPDIIVLQEANLEFIGGLLNNLPKWTIRTNKKGSVMLFKSRDQGGRLEIKEYAHNKKDVHHDGVNMQDCQSALFEVDGYFNRRIKVNNVHTAFYQTPEHHEAYYQHLLSQEAEGVVSLVVGDMNTRIAPREDTGLRNIATGVVPGMFNEIYGAKKNEQMTDFPDAAFTRDENGDIQQLDRQILDYRTGKIFEEAPSEQNAVAPKWAQFRMLMCLDNFKGAKDKIEGKAVFEFEAHLSRYFPNSNVLVRKAAKDNNERGFGFRFSKAATIFKFIQKSLEQKFKDEPSDYQCIFYDDMKTGQRIPMVFVHETRTPEFLALINPVIEALKSIDNRIKGLESSEKNPFLRSGLNKIERLTELRASILASIGEKSVSEIVSAWENQVVSVDGQNKSTSEIMLEKRNKFVGTFFYKKPPPASKTEECISSLKKIKASGDEAQRSDGSSAMGLNNNNN